MQALGKLELLKAEFTKAVHPEPVSEGPRPSAAATVSLPLIGGMPDPKQAVRSGVLVLTCFFGFIGLWAALSPIDSAAISYGVIGAEGSRKAVQHLDGGVVSAILIKEGGLVTAGQELIRLDQVQPRAALEISTGAVRTLAAVISRLEAEASGTDIRFPEFLTKQAEDPTVSALLASQQQLFAARKVARETQIGTLVEQIKQARVQSEIYGNQVKTAERQYAMVNEELAPKEMLFEKGYATNSPVLQLKRAATALLGQKQEALGQISRLDYTISQLQSQISQINGDFRVRVASELEDSRSKLADAKERERVAKDVLDRTVIRAPVSGRVLGLSVNTVGGVVIKGERLLEIVPENAGIVIKARFKPTDGIEISEGMKAELRILSAQGRKLPMLYGTVRNRSADARTDPENKSSYFDVDVVVGPEELSIVDGGRLALGTPVEIIVPTGSRTVLEYMIEPISESLRHGMREK